MISLGWGEDTRGGNEPQPSGKSSPGAQVTVPRTRSGVARKLRLGGGQTGFWSFPLCWLAQNVHVGGGELRAKPESRARSARELRAKPESRARSAREMRAKHESRAKPRLSGGRGLGRGSVSPSPENFENSYLKPCILVYIWSENLLFPSGRSWNMT